MPNLDSKARSQVALAICSTDSDHLPPVARQVESWLNLLTRSTKQLEGFGYAIDADEDLHAALLMAVNGGYVELSQELQVFSDGLGESMIALATWSGFWNWSSMVFELQKAWPAAHTRQAVGPYSARLTEAGSAAREQCEQGGIDRTRVLQYACYHNELPREYWAPRRCVWRVVKPPSPCTGAHASASAVSSVGDIHIHNHLPPQPAPEVNVTVSPEVTTADPTPSEKKPGRPAAGTQTTDDLMRSKLHDDPDSLHWSASKWKAAIGRAEATIKESDTWAEIMEARDAAKQERAERDAKQRSEPTD